MVASGARDVPGVRRVGSGTRPRPRGPTVGGEEARAVRWRRFVAVGDSFTEGLDDPYPHGGYRGWADLVAAALAARVGRPTAVAGAEGRVDGAGGVDDEPFRYANLAIRGRLFDRVVTEQVPAALAMEPDLVSFAAGGNDVLRPRFDGRTLVARLDTVIGRFRRGGADVILFRFVDLSTRLPGRRLTGPRVALINQAIVETAERHGAVLVDLWRDDEFANPLLWSEDRLHLSTAGHRRVAAHVLAALGVEPEPEWWEVPPPPPRRPWAARKAADLGWAGRHLAPWVMRRLTGRSSGDGVTAKRPRMEPFGDEPGPRNDQTDPEPRLGIR